MPDTDNATPKADCFTPCKLISLWDIMNHFCAGLTFEEINRLEGWAKDVSGWANEFGDRTPLSKKHALTIVAVLDDAERYLKAVGLQDAEIHRIKVILSLWENVDAATPVEKMGTAYTELSYAVVADRIKTFQRQFIDALQTMEFAYFPKESAEYFEEEFLIRQGEYAIHPPTKAKKVLEKFPEAQDDIKAANNCMAAELHTAAVFHLTRVAGIGIRKMFGRSKIPTVGSVSFNQETWNLFLQDFDKRKKEVGDKSSQLTEELQKLRKSTSSTAEQIAALENRIADLEKERHFLISMSLAVTGLKDIYRNPVGHECEPVKAGAASDAYADVKKFMETLAENL